MSLKLVHTQVSRESLDVFGVEVLYSYPIIQSLNMYPNRKRDIPLRGYIFPLIFLNLCPGSN